MLMGYHTSQKPALKRFAVVLHMSQMEPLPVTITQVLTGIRDDPILAKIYDLTVNGWPAHGDNQLPEYSN